MKHWIVTLLLLATALPAAADSLIGTWRLTGGEFRGSDGKMLDYQKENFTGYKVINANHFSFVSRRDGQFWAAASGTYTHADGRYIEQLVIASFGAPGGSTYEFRSRLEGDDWYTERFEDGERVEYEHWQRVVD